MELYSFWRSSTAFRVRIGLNLKGCRYTIIPIDLVGGEQRGDTYTALNPGQGVPALRLEDGSVLAQSMAILEWLEETVPDPSFLPAEPAARARVRAAALVIASDIHPLNNTRVINRLKSMGHSQDAAIEWMNEWMARGLLAFQRMIDTDSLFCFGNAPGLADICLVPQVYNARKWGMDLTGLGRLEEIDRRCMQHEAFQRAAPDRQPDAGNG